MYTFDTETSYNPETRTAWVWGWSLCDENYNVTIGDGTNTLAGLFSLPSRSEIWVHNLPYDAEFLYYELRERGYKCIYNQPTERILYHGVFTFREDLNGVISMTIFHRGKIITLRDSLRIFRAKLEKLPKICGFEDKDAKAEEIVYNDIRPRDYKPTEQERDYMAHDVTVLMRAMKWIKEYTPHGGNTIGSIAVNDFKHYHGGHSPFTPLDLDEWRLLRSLYSGGVAYCPCATSRRVLNVSGRCYDRNSMYPAEGSKALPVALAEITPNLPHGGGCWALHVQAEELELKRDGFPCLVTPFSSSAREIIPKLDKWIYAPELWAITEDYNIKSFNVVESARFEVADVASGWFSEWYKVKQNEPERRSLAKYLINNLTGKVAQSPIQEGIQRLNGDVNEVYNYIRVDEVSEVNKWVFMPWTAKITSDSRLALRDAARKSGIEHLMYTDTDSIHTTGTLPADMIDEGALGYWKQETEFDEALYIKPKSYYERLGGETVSQHHAGIPVKAREVVKYTPDNKPVYGGTICPDNMTIGAEFATLQNVRVVGGCALLERIKHL